MSLAEPVTGPLELITFQVANVVCGVRVRTVQEINRHLDLTPVPCSPDFVRGVLNLRGEVVTVLDLRAVLGFGKAEASSGSRNLILSSEGERIALLVDGVKDVVVVQPEEIDRPPENFSSVESHRFSGVCKLSTGLVALLDVESVLASEEMSSQENLEGNANQP